jgi:hypothetical protein
MVGIGVRHADALGRQPIQVGGFRVAAALDAQVAITQVVGDDQNDVAPARRLGVGRARCDQHQGGKSFTGMAGSRVPIAVTHSEGFADFSQRGDAQRVLGAMRFVDGSGAPTETYPANPNGSPGGHTAVTTADGRFTALMPHPERVFRNLQMSFAAGGEESAASPWLRMFRNLRRWVA